MWIVSYFNPHYPNHASNSMIGFSEEEEYARNFCEHANILLKNSTHLNKITLLNGKVFHKSGVYPGKFHCQHVSELKANKD